MHQSIAFRVGAPEHWITLTWKPMLDGTWTCLYYIAMPVHIVYPVMLRVKTQVIGRITAANSIETDANHRFCVQGVVCIEKEDVGALSARRRARFERLKQWWEYSDEDR